MSDQDDHYEHLEEMELLEMSIYELKKEIELLTDMTAQAQRLAINKGLEVERLKRQLEKCKVQRNSIYVDEHPSDYGTLIDELDAEIEGIE